jgi:hypothetical protein
MGVSKARPPGRGWRFLAERDSGERALGDRHERRLRVWQIGTERLVKPAGVDRELGAAIRQLGRLDIRPDDGRWKPRLELGDDLPLSGRHPRDAHQPDHVVRRP